MSNSDCLKSSKRFAVDDFEEKPNSSRTYNVSIQKQSTFRSINSSFSLRSEFLLDTARSKESECSDFVNYKNIFNGTLNEIEDVFGTLQRCMKKDASITSKGNSKLLNEFNFHKVNSTQNEVVFDNYRMEIESLRSQLHEKDTLIREHENHTKEVATDFNEKLHKIHKLYMENMRLVTDKQNKIGEDYQISMSNLKIAADEIIRKKNLKIKNLETTVKRYQSIAETQSSENLSCCKDNHLKKIINSTALSMSQSQNSIRNLLREVEEYHERLQIKSDHILDFLKQQE